MLAPDGRCKTFDAAADGYGRGEGAAVLVLKRLSDAQAAGDRIRAVIRGSAVNQDGPSSGLTVPNGPAQQAVIRRALVAAGVQAEEIDYLEAHGTGTALGDPIEMGALGAVFQGRAAPLWVGSVKTNVGHLEAAAGLAGLIKVVLALEHEAIPPHLHFHQPSPHIPWPTLPLRVPTTLVPWPRGPRVRRAGVSSFGFSGTNAHVIVEEAPAAAETRRRGDAEKAEGREELVLVSGKSAAAMRTLAAKYAEHLRATPAVRLADVALTSSVGRAHFNYRGAVRAASVAEACERLEALARGETGSGVFLGEAGSAPPPLAFLFSGQGAQYAGMGRRLYQSEPVFRRELDRCADLLRDELPCPLLDVLFGDTAGLLDQTRYTQPAIFSLQWALAALWRHWGVRPAWVLGHSVGEYAAAAVAGVFSLEDGLRLIAARGRLMQQLPAGGTMVAVATDQATAAAALEGEEAEVAIAAVNAPQQVVLSGTAAAVARVVARLPEGTRAQPLAVSHAFHSPRMQPMLDAFAAVAATVSYRPPQCRVIGNRDGQLAGEELLAADYWVAQIRRPVCFAAGMTTLWDSGARTFLELGPAGDALGAGPRLSYGDR